MDLVFLLDDTRRVVSVCMIWDSSDEIGEYSLVEYKCLDFWYEKSDDLLLATLDCASLSDFLCRFRAGAGFFPAVLLSVSLTVRAEASFLGGKDSCFGCFRPPFSAFGCSLLTLSRSRGSDVDLPLCVCLAS